MIGVHHDAFPVPAVSPVKTNHLYVANDQRMPVLAVKSDGTKLFMGWYDRRSDTNSSLIDVYGRWATIASDGNVTFYTNDFRITTTNFPPVFAGTSQSNTNQGHYDPVYSPRDVNLDWHYSAAWPPPPQAPPDTNLTVSAWQITWENTMVRGARVSISISPGLTPA